MLQMKSPKINSFFLIGFGLIGLAAIPDLLGGKKLSFNEGQPVPLPQIPEDDPLFPVPDPYPEYTPPTTPPTTPPIEPPVYEGNIFTASFGNNVAYLTVNYNGTQYIDGLTINAYEDSNITLSGTNGKILLRVQNQNVVKVSLEIDGVVVGDALINFVNRTVI